MTLRQMGFDETGSPTAPLSADETTQVAYRCAIVLEPFRPSILAEQGDLKASTPIPSFLNGRRLKRAQAHVTGAAGSGTGTTTIQVRNLTTNTDMLTSPISIATTGTTGTAGTVNTSTNTVSTDQRVGVDFDTLSSTPPTGVQILLEFY